MKQCPACHRMFTDDALNFCRHDGTALTTDSSQLSLESQPTSPKLPLSPMSHSGVVGAGNLSTSDLPTTVLPRKRRSTSKIINSLVVLPFDNASTDQQMEYLSDGITESITNGLSQIPKLRVVPRSTAFRYKGNQADPLVVGNNLEVRGVVTGRVLQVGELLVVRAELIDVDQQSQLWGEEYRRGMGDIFAIQEEISREISSKLRLHLSGDERKRLAKRYTENTEAYHFYLKGRYYTNKRTTDWIKKGIEHFQQAIELDQKYALAYAGLADAYAFLASSTGECRPTEWYPKAKDAALKALQLDEMLAEAHASLGFSRLLYDWDFDSAKREFKRAIKLNPSFANAHDGYSFYLKATGQHEKAIRACQDAQKLEPLSLFATISLGWAYYFARDYDQAVSQHRKALEMDPQSAFAHWNLGMALVQLDKMDEAIEAFRQADTHSGGGLTFKAHLGFALALAGQHDEARGIITELETMARQRYVSSYHFAIIYLGLGEFDRTFDYLDSACDERSGFMSFIKVEPMLDPLRSDPRFDVLEGRIWPRSS